MPASRARTAICSAPLEWPSRPGFPTRILIRRPSPSLTRSTSSRSSAVSAEPSIAAASPTPVGALEQGRRLALGVLVEADDDLLAALDPAQALTVRVDERGLHVVHAAHRAAVLGDDRHLGAGALEQLCDEPVHDLRALEDVGV